MSQELVNLIGDSMWNAIGGLADLMGFIVLGILFLFLIKNRVDRGGLALMGILVLGYAARPILVEGGIGGFGLIPVWIFYVVLIACAILAGKGFLNIQER